MDSESMQAIVESGAVAVAVTVGEDGLVTVWADDWVTESPDRDELLKFIAASIERIRQNLADGGDGNVVEH